MKTPPSTVAVATIAAALLIGQSILGADFNSLYGDRYAADDFSIGIVAAVYLWLVLSGVAGVVAHHKGREGLGYFCLSLVLSPLAGVILACALPPIERSDTSDDDENGPQRPKAKSMYQRQQEAIRKAQGRA